MPERSLIKIPDVVYLLAAMWLVHLLQWLLPGNLHHYGILPRTVEGLLHIPLAPFLHGSLFHIIANSFPLLGLGFLVQLKQRALFWELVIIISLLAGLGTWVIGGTSYHIGASGLVLGLWSFMLADGCFRRSIRSMAIALVTLVFYGGLVFTLFDLRPNISWAGHASGVAAGVVIAWLNAKGETTSANST